MQVFFFFHYYFHTLQNRTEPYSAHALSYQQVLQSWLSTASFIIQLASSEITLQGTKLYT